MRRCSSSVVGRCRPVAIRMVISASGCPCGSHQQDGQGDLAGDGAGVVTGDQHNFLFTLGQVTQARGGNGMLQCLMNQFYFRFAGLVFVHFCGDNSFQVGFVNMPGPRWKYSKESRWFSYKCLLGCGCSMFRITNIDCIHHTFNTMIIALRLDKVNSLNQNSKKKHANLYNATGKRFTE